MKLCLLFFTRILVLVTLNSSLSESSSAAAAPFSYMASSHEVRSVIEEKEQNTDFTIGMCILSLGRYDINDNKQINRTEFQYVIHHVCDGNNYTAIANFRDSDASLVSLNQTIWDDVFVEAACTCQSYDSSNSKSSNNTKGNDTEENCCDPNNVNKNVVYRPGKYSSNYTYTICRYLQTVFQQYDCIPNSKATAPNSNTTTNDGDEGTDIPTTAPMLNNIITTPTMSPTVPSMLPIPMLRMPKINTSAGTNDTKLNSGILIVLILLSFIVGTIILYMSKKTMMNKNVRKAKFSSENAMEINGNDNYDVDDNDNIDAELPTSPNDSSLCCWWYPVRRQQHREQLHDSSTIIAVEAIAKGSVIRKNTNSRIQQPTVSNLDHENTAYESYSNDDEYNCSHQYYDDKDNDANEIIDGMIPAEGQRRRSNSNNKRKKKDDDIVVLVVAATPHERNAIETKKEVNDLNSNPKASDVATGTTTTTTTTTTTMGDIDDDPKLTSQGHSSPSKPYLNLVTLSTAAQTAVSSSSSSAPSTSQYYRYSDADTEPYNDLMYAGSNQYFDNVSLTNTNNNHLNMILLQQQQQIQAILNESDDDDDDDHNNNIDVYVDDVDDSSSDTSSGSSTSASADSSKSSTTLENINNSNADSILNSPHRLTLLQRVDENDEDDIDPDTNTTSSSSSSSAGIISNSSSMVALLSDPLLPPSLYTHNTNNSSVLDHGENVIPTKRPTTITTTIQTTQYENDQATPTKATNIGSENGNKPQNITSKTLISSSSITPNRLASVVITPNTNDSDRSNDSHDEGDEDDDINILLQQYHQKPLSQGSVTNSDAANDDDQFQKLSYGDTSSISTQTVTSTIATNTRSLGAGNTPINISPSHEDFNVTLQWNTNPTTTTSALNIISVNEQVNDSDSNSVESTQVPLQEQRSDEAVDGHEDFDDATTVVISNQNQASSLFRHIFQSPNKIEYVKTHSTTESKNDNPKHTIPSSSPPPVQTVITKSKNVITPSKARTADSKITSTAVV